MTDDIVIRLRGSADCTCLFHTEHGLTRKCLFCESADEIERLRSLLDNTLERENRDNARQLEIVRKVGANRDMWRNTCTKLVGMMLPFSLLMKPNEQEELIIILREAKESVKRVAGE